MSPPAPADVRALLFDLDGTLLDTAPDLAAALNRVLADAGRAPLPAETIRPHVSQGGRALIRLGFGITEDDPEFAMLRRAFLDHYQAHIAEHTRPFHGIEALLDEWEAGGRPWGVVTNKPGWLAGPLLAALGLTARAGCIIGGDTTARAKPAPDPLLEAARRLGLAPPACLYVGDDRRDVEAARAAGMPVLVAGWGYLGPGEAPGDWGADGIIERAEQVIPWLNGQLK